MNVRIINPISSVKFTKHNITIGFNRPSPHFIIHFHIYPIITITMNYIVTSSQLHSILSSGSLSTIYQ